MPLGVTHKRKMNNTVYTLKNAKTAKVRQLLKSHYVFTECDSEEELLERLAGLTDMPVAVIAEESEAVCNALSCTPVAYVTVDSLSGAGDGNLDTEGLTSIKAKGIITAASDIKKYIDFARRRDDGSIDDIRSAAVDASLGNQVYLQLYANELHEAILIYDLTNGEVECNEFGSDMFGLPRRFGEEQLNYLDKLNVGRKTETVRSYLTSPNKSVHLSLRRLLNTVHGTRWYNIIILSVFSATGEVIRRVARLLDVDEMIAAINKWHELADRDSATGLFNRAAFEAHCNDALNAATNSAVVFIDMDNFKTINDSYGHNYGDRLIKRTAARIRTYFEEHGYEQRMIAGRIGGDEFGVCLTNYKSVQELRRLFNSFCEYMTETQPALSGRNIVLTASVGVSLYPDDGNDIMTLIEKADVACYNVKANLKNGYAIYANEMVQSQGKPRGQRIDEYTDITELKDLIKSSSPEQILTLIKSMTASSSRAYSKVIKALESSSMNLWEADFRNETIEFLVGERDASVTDYQSLMNFYANECAEEKRDEFLAATSIPSLTKIARSGQLSTFFAIEAMNGGRRMFEFELRPSDIGLSSVSVLTHFQSPQNRASYLQSDPVLADACLKFLPVLYFDAKDRRLIYANDSLLSILGYSSFTMLFGTNGNITRILKKKDAARISELNKGDTLALKCADKSFKTVPIGSIITYGNKTVVAFGYDDDQLETTRQLEALCRTALVDFVECRLTDDDLKFVIKSSELEKWLAARFKLAPNDDNDLELFLADIKPQVEGRMRNGERRFEYTRNGSGYFLRYLFKITCEFVGETTNGIFYDLVIAFDSSNDSNSTDEERRVRTIISSLTDSPDMNRAMILRELREFYRARSVDIVDDSFFGDRERTVELIGEGNDIVLLSNKDSSVEEFMAEKDSTFIAVITVESGKYCVLIDPADYRPHVFETAARLLKLQSPSRGVNDVLQKLQEVSSGIIAFSFDVMKNPPHSVLKVKYVSDEAASFNRILNEPGITVTDLLHPDDGAGVIAALSDVSDGSVARISCRALSNTGYLPVVCHITCVSGVVSVLIHEARQTNRSSVDVAATCLLAAEGVETHAYNVRTGDMETYIVENGKVKGMTLSAAAHSLISNGRVHSDYGNDLSDFLTGKRDTVVYRARVGDIYKWKRGYCYHREGDIRYLATAVIGRLAPDFKLDVPDLVACYLFDLTSSVAFRRDRDDARMVIADAVREILSHVFGEEHKHVIEHQISRVALLDAFDSGKYYYYTTFLRVGESGNIGRSALIVRMHVSERRICATIVVKDMSACRKEVIAAHADSDGFFTPAAYSALIGDIKSSCGEMIIKYSDINGVKQVFGDYFESVVSNDIACLLHYYLPGDAIISVSDTGYRVCLPSEHNRLALAEYANKIVDDISPSYYERNSQKKIMASIDAHMINEESDFMFSRFSLEDNRFMNSIPIAMIILDESLENASFNTAATEMLGEACSAFADSCRKLIRSAHGSRVFSDKKKGIRVVRTEDQNNRWYVCMLTDGVQTANETDILVGLSEAFAAQDLDEALLAFIKYLRHYYEADGIYVFGGENSDKGSSEEYVLTKEQQAALKECIGNKSAVSVDNIAEVINARSLSKAYKAAKKITVLQTDERYIVIANPKRNELQHKPAFVCARAVAYRNREQRLQNEIKYTRLHDPETGALVYKQLTAQFGTLDGVNCVGVAVINFFMMPDMRTELDHERFVPVKRKIIATAQKVFGENSVFVLSSEKYAIVCYNYDEDAYYGKLEEYERQLGSDSRNVSIGSVWEDSQINLRRLIETAREFSTVIKRYDEESTPQERSIVAEEIEKGYYQVYLQPKLDLNSDTVTGAEALVRKIVDGEVVSPGYFIPIMEQNGETYIVDLFVLETVCAYIKSCDDEGLRPPDISVNFSRQTVLLPDASERAKAICEKYGVSPSWIEIEITESIGAISLNTLKAAAAKLHDVGFNLSLDDFGAEYSSYAILSAIDFSVIKIDKSMINNIVGNERARLAVRSIIDFCHNANINCLAEGVESYEQKSLLSVMSCDLIQGYITNKPMPINIFTELYVKKHDDMF